MYMDDMDKRDHRAGLKGMGIGAMAPPKTSNPMTIYIECKSEEHRKKENSVSRALPLFRSLLCWALPRGMSF